MSIEKIREALRNDGASSRPDPEVPERAQRRRFSAEYKLRILKEAEAYTEPGEIGALLRREGLYSSHLSDWRRQRDAGALQALGQKRGRRVADKRDKELARLTRENERLSRRLARAEKIIEIQAKVSELLGIAPAQTSEDESGGR